MLSVVALAACAEPVEKAAKTAEEEQVERLRALGYIDAAPGRAEARATTEVLNRARAMPGYRLYVSRRTCEAFLIDLDGVVVRRWAHEPCGAWVRADLTASGDLLVIGQYATQKVERRGDNPKRRYLMKMEFAGPVVWTADIWAHHDAEQQANGEILVLTRSLRRDHPWGDLDLVDNGIARLSPAGEVLDSLSLYDLLRDNDVGFELRPVEPDPWMDLLHTNSLERMRRPALAAVSPLYGLDNVVVSSRHQDAVFIFDLAKRKLVWAWGPGEVSAQHDAQVLDSGNLLIFDNGLAAKRSRVIEVDPRSNRIVWSYDGGEEETFFTEGRGGSQRLANGNILVAVSNRGTAFEATPDGEVVWRFWNPDMDDEGRRGVIIRMVNYDREMIDRLLGAAPR